VAAGGAVARNPGAVAGCTAFLVALSFISANALWNQERPHTTTFFVTREPAEPSVWSDDRSEAAPETGREQTAGIVPPIPRPADPIVEYVQAMLLDLDLYAGSVDGIAGPQTRKAIEDYQRLAGLEASGEITDALLRDLDTRRRGEAGVPAPMPRPAADETAARGESGGGLSRDDIVRVQAGLKAFGHDGIDIDGLAGAKTKAAVREFQSLFGMPVTGEPDRALMDKMREIGLTN
jgi:peptidoglycan hydrolase-like protein with peptidoglycan-binding domain